MQFEWDPAKDASNRAKHGMGLGEATTMTDDLPELTDAQLATAILHSTRERIMRGKIRGGADVAALRRFVAMSQAEFARVLGISVHTLRNWEQDRREPHGPALALLRIAARHPRVLRETLAATV